MTETIQSHKKIRLIQLGSKRYMVCSPAEETEFYDYPEAMNYYMGLVRLYYGIGVE